MLISFVPTFLFAISIYPSSSARSKFLGTSCNSLTQQPTPPRLLLNFIGFQFGNELILNWLPMHVHRSLHDDCNQYLSSLLLHSYIPSHQLSSASLNLLVQHRIHIALVSRGLRHASPSIWNPSLPPNHRSIDSYTAFKSNLKTHLLLTQAFLGILPQAILSVRFWFDIIHVDFCVENTLYYMTSYWWRASEAKAFESCLEAFRISIRFVCYISLPRTSVTRSSHYEPGKVAYFPRIIDM